MDNFVTEDMNTGKRTHTDLISGSFTVHCVSRNGLEAEKIALLVAKALKTYRRELQLAGFFQIGQVIRIGNESPANSILPGDSDEDFITVPVSFPVFYQESWTATPMNTQLITKIVYTAYAVARQFDGSLIYPDSFDSDGNPSESSEGVIVGAWTLESE